MPPSVLHTILTPIDPAIFKSEYFHKHYLHIGGNSPKFANLMPWSALNDILRHHSIDVPRLRLIKNGKDISAASFLRYDQSTGGFSLPRLKVTEFTAELRSGATLLISSIDEMYEPLTHLAEQLERDLNLPVHVNLYAGWRTCHGFDLHWDDHDVFILQVAGRKEWSLYGETVKYPIRRIDQEQKPTGQPVWTGVLESGDLLYIPRGWWHLARPLDEPTLHLTVGFAARTGLHIIQWLTEQLGCHECIRADIPISADTAIQDEYVMELQDVILRTCTQNNLLQRFLRDSNARAAVRPRLGLPWTATPNILPPEDSYVLFCRLPRKVSIFHRKESATIEVGFEGKMLTLHEDTLPLFEFLSNSTPIALRMFYNAFGTVFPREELETFLSDITTQGIISFSASDETMMAAPCQMEVIQDSQVGG